MGRWQRHAAVALAALAVAACGGRAAEAPAQGVRGVVLRGPMCPVEREGSPCPDEPVPGARVLVLRAGEVVAETRSGPGGRFEVGLDPGRYTLEVEPGRAGVAAAPVDAVVPARSFVEVTLSIDTGIR